MIEWGSLLAWPKGKDYSSINSNRDGEDLLMLLTHQPKNGVITEGELSPIFFHLRYVNWTFFCHYSSEQLETRNRKDLGGRAPVRRWLQETNRAGKNPISLPNEKKVWLYGQSEEEKSAWVQLVPALSVQVARGVYQTVEEGEVVKEPARQAQ